MSLSKLVACNCQEYSRWWIYIPGRYNVVLHYTPQNEHRRGGKENNVNCMAWPYQSPAIYTIENMWLTIKIKLENKKHFIKTHQDRIDHVKAIWYSLSVHYIQSILPFHVDYDKLSSALLSYH